MGEQVDVVISEDCRDIVRGIECRVESDARKHQNRREAQPFVLPEEIRNGNHQREQGQHTQHHAGDNTDRGLAGGGRGVALHEMFLHRRKVERGSGRERGTEHRGRNKDPLTRIEIHIIVFSLDPCMDEIIQ